MINTTEKQDIKALLLEYVDRSGSQNKAANSLKNVSSATISQIKNDQWELISEAMWRTVGSQTGWNSTSWVTVNTRDYEFVTTLLADAQTNSQVYALTGHAGCGKSLSFKDYAEKNKYTYLIKCSEFWNRKFFLSELLIAMGRDCSGLTVAEMMQEVVQVLKKQKNPMILMDEFDKVSDQVLYFFITLFNQLEDHCALVMCATDHLSKRIKKGLKLNKKGYNEIYSRIGRKFIELEGIGNTDIYQVCEANGISDKKIIKSITEDSEYDLRRVKRKIHGVKLMQQSNQAV